MKSSTLLLVFIAMASEKFRRQLRQESEKWWAEGLINADLYKQLADRYQFQRLEGDASNHFTVILLSLGSILLGLAAITFVAANWQVWSRSLKMTVLLSCFIGVNVAGFHLWRKPAAQKGYQRLGQALLLLGGLLLGANLGLMSQLFHQSGEIYELLLIWGLGVAVMTYSLRLGSLGLLALILVTLGYWCSWITSAPWKEFSGTALVVQHFPLVMAGVFVPLAYWCRSRAIFGLSALTLVLSLVFNLKPWLIWNIGGLLAIAFVLPPALLWSYSDRLWQRSPAATVRSSTADFLSPFQSIARSLAIYFLAGLLYLLAYRAPWESSTGNSYWLADWSWYPLIDAAILAIVAGLGWMNLRHQLRLPRFQERAVNSGAIALGLIAIAVLLIWHVELKPISAVLTLSFNMLLFLLALGLIRDGLALAQRNTFWGGMVLLVLSLISRVLEYNTGLLLKSIVFAVCGVGIMAAGLWFERNVRPHRAPSLPSATQENLP